MRYCSMCGGEVDLAGKVCSMCAGVEGPAYREEMERQEQYYAQKRYEEKQWEIEMERNRDA